ncbi:uncharacterized protein TNCV_2680291 [Trichonephila clavipes]|uniref:RNase H type-1 domain-containing protein n=1 Tax=Trichonephila clavipes TaxID=2585209 RepID=A0A8X6S7R2_TRICX|nr:uncharacterized protein TNCV_2680291 [Trichonephila clavipes]
MNASFFKTELSSDTNKGTQHPAYLRQLALETIYKIPCEELQTYTDAIVGVGAVSGSEIFIKKGNSVKICKRNPDYCTIFRAELLAIAETLKMCFTESVNTDVWVLSDSQSSIQHLSQWWSGYHHTHMNVSGNEIADGLAREGSHKDSTNGSCLTSSEITTRVKQDISSSLRQAPVHEWYEGNRPGADLLGTTLFRLRSGYIPAQRHVVGLKSYPPCPNYNVTQATPVAILSSLRFFAEPTLHSIDPKIENVWDVIGREMTTPTAPRKLPELLVWIVPYYIVSRFSSIPGLTGLCVAGIFSGSLSTLSSALNSLSAVTVIDLIKPIYKSRLSETKMVYIAKMLSFCYGIICICFSFVISKVDSLVAINQTVLSVVEGPVFAVFCIAVLSRKGSEKNKRKSNMQKKMPFSPDRWRCAVFKMTEHL